MTPVFINAVAVSAPGLDGWEQARGVLRGDAAWQARPLEKYAPTLLPANERRRATRAVRLAFRVAEEAIQQCEPDPATLASVFASSDADTWILERLCTALAAETPMVSPTDFHNSVHNAAPGYWHIATGSRAPSSSLSAFDASFAAGLREAVLLVQAEAIDCLLTVYDVQPPESLQPCRQITQSAAVALLLSPQPSAASLASLQLEPGDGQESVMEDASLEALRQASPAMRALPLLRDIALAHAGELMLAAAGGGTLRLRTRPC